ncbi:MAG: Uma2 family endonuclease [Deltaproteobacteria bacterium]|nr:Uma2 family endonuclease [Deltaproteobacteria bacterium]
MSQAIKFDSSRSLSSQRKIPPLENGDHLTRPEFERRYAAMPYLKKAELIEGVVYMPSPVRYEGHGRQHAEFSGWLVLYSASTPGVAVADNTTVRLDLDNEPQPDLLLRVIEDGQSQVATDGFLDGAPELVVEVASSSTAYDLHQKLDTYRRHGVREYIVWQTLDNIIDWFVLREGWYEHLLPEAGGVYKSEVFPGLWLNSTAMTQGDLATVFSVLREGLATSEH